MKYDPVCLSLGALCLAAGLGIAVGTVLRRGIRRGARIGALVLAFVLLAAGAAAGSLAGYYPASAETAALEEDVPVTVTAIPRGWLFDGPGTDRAIVFLPGARVEAWAYASLLRGIAAQGTDCFLLRMPFRMAVLDFQAPRRILEEYPYEHWYLMGHSLGGAVAGRFAAACPEVVEGLILLAAYPDRKLAPSLRLLSIRGSEDGVLRGETYDRSREYWPPESREVLLEGGNHAGFGDYGPQKGDGTAVLSPAGQQARTREAIGAFLSP